MTNLKSTTNTLNTLVVLFIFAFAANTSLAQKVLNDVVYEPGITAENSGIVIKSTVSNNSNFLLINKDQELLGGFQARKFSPTNFISGLVDVNQQYYMRHQLGGKTDFMTSTFIDDKWKPTIHMSVFKDGRVTIGNIQTTSPMINKVGGGNYEIDDTGEKIYLPSSPDISGEDFKLIVQTGILTEKVKVAGLTTDQWADYVFEEDYEMLPIEELESYVKENKHLPNVPSAQEVAENGLDLAKIDATLLEKIEESYLYIIELNKKFDALAAENNGLKTKLKALQTGQN